MDRHTRVKVAGELIKLAKTLTAKKLWSVGDGWHYDDLGGYDVEDYVMYAVFNMLKKLKLKIKIDYPISSFHGNLGRQIGLPRKWDKKNIEKVLDDLTDINYHSERRNIEDALEDRGIIIAGTLVSAKKLVARGKWEINLGVVSGFQSGSMDEAYSEKYDSFEELLNDKDMWYDIKNQGGRDWTRTGASATGAEYEGEWEMDSGEHFQHFLDVEFPERMPNGVKMLEQAMKKNGMRI